MKRFENIKHFILGVIIGGILFNVGCIRKSASNIVVVHDTVVPTNVEKTIFNLRVQIDLLKDSIIILNKKLDCLQYGNIKQRSSSAPQKQVTAAIAKLNYPHFTQKDLDNAIKEASNAGILKQYQALFNACQQVLNFCKDIDGRTKSPDLLKKWVKGKWYSDATKGEFADLPDKVKKTLQELVQDERLYNRYTHSTKFYFSLRDMLELNDY